MASVRICHIRQAGRQGAQEILAAISRADVVRCGLSTTGSLGVGEEGKNGELRQQQQVVGRRTGEGTVRMMAVAARK